MSRGLGATAEQIARCTPKADFWSWGTWVAALDPECWAYSPDAWRQMASIPQLPAPVVNLPPPPSNLPPASASEAQATVDSIIAQNKAAQDAQYQQFFESVNPIPEYGNATGGMGWMALAGIGVLGVVILSSFTGRRRRR